MFRVLTALLVSLLCGYLVSKGSSIAVHIAPISIKLYYLVCAYVFFFSSLITYLLILNRSSTKLSQFFVRLLCVSMLTSSLFYSVAAVTTITNFFYYIWLDAAFSWKNIYQLIELTIIISVVINGINNLISRNSFNFGGGFFLGGHNKGYDTLDKKQYKE